MRLEVRCCCQPRKLLGWMTIPDHLAKRETALRVFVTGGTTAHVFSTGEPAPTGDIITLRVRELDPGWDFEPYLAISSEETPIEVLRRCRAFEEAPPV